MHRAEPRTARAGVWTRPASGLWACALLLAAACSEAESGPVAAQDVALPGGDVSFQIDTTAQDDAVADTEAPDVPADVTDTDAGPADAAEEIAPDVPAVDAGPVCPGDVGCACTGNGECETGFCIDHGDGLRCAATCVGECPAGFACVTVSTGGSDAATICAPAALHLCEPCATSKDCPSLGDGGAACVDRGALGRFCGAGCTTTADCPSGYACQEALLAEGTQALQCVLADATADCACSAAAVAKKLATTCYLEVAGEEGQPAAKCLGTRVCLATGLGKCTAPAPTAEACNGADDDCDGQTDELTCVDGNSCTQDACDASGSAGNPGTGGCQNLPLDGLGCDADGSVCTQNDACKGGTCLAGPIKPCDDGNPCTLGACDPAGGCTQTFDDGAPCDDDNPCTIGDTCAAGGCTAGAAKKCDPGKPCVLGDCSLQTGKCVYVDKAAGAACDDGDVCTGPDGCQGGLCTGATLGCDDGNPCTTDACKAGVGCANTASTAPCDDGQACTTGDTCQGGTCQPGSAVACDDGKPCTVDACNALTGKCDYDAKPQQGKACDADGSVCTVGDACQDGTCQAGPALACDDGKPCTDDACKADMGCTHTASTKPCDDGQACTTGDTCQGGACQPGSAVVCDDGKPCTVDACNPTTGKCEYDAKPQEGKACDADGSACTVGDACQDGTCKAGPAKNCDDGNPCTDDACKPASGCVVVANSAPCDDGDACTSGDACNGGDCEAKPKTCDDGNACTLDGCAKLTGCTIVPTTEPCNDGNACTTDDKCGNGACAGASVSCDDGNGCTADACDATSGCSHVNTTAPCPDGDACTTGEVCSGGSCGKQAVVCDDGNACTADTCDPAKGCQHATLADGTDCGPQLACKAGQCLSKCPPGDTVTVLHTGKATTFTVPACVTALQVEVVGAQGGTSTGGSQGGFGAKVTGTVSVQPGEVLTLVVGGQAAPAPYPCGGGGGSFVVRNGAPLLVAGGGGGGYSNWAQTGHSTALSTGGTGTGGGTNNNGGGGGGFHLDGVPAASGGKSYVNGSAGGNEYPLGEKNCSKGGFGGGGGSSMSGTFNAGGGGGYVGGNAGNGNAATGGSSYIAPGVGNGVHTPKVNSGHGRIVIGW